MEEVNLKREADDEEKQAELEIWNYAFGFIPMAVVKCAIELQIPEILETHGGAMTHADLASAVGCSPPVLRRIMRYLIHRRIFKQTPITGQEKESSISYTQTPLSKLLIKNRGNSMAALVMMESSRVMLDSWHNLSSKAIKNGDSPFKTEHGVDIREYISANPAHSKLFNDAMGCIARQCMAAFVDKYPAAFNGIASLVDVGGGDGTALRSLIKAFPWIRGINFDLPHVVCVAAECDGVEHVAGNMFDFIPKADAAFLMRVLRNWSDQECIQILKNCREAIPLDKGKVIVAEAAISEVEEHKYSDVWLALDMVMLAHTKRGKQRTIEEWEYIVKEAGFTRFTVTNIDAVISIIEAYP